jgi:flagellar hook-length control protein FliK
VAVPATAPVTAPAAASEPAPAAAQAAASAVAPAQAAAGAPADAATAEIAVAAANPVQPQASGPKAKAADEKDAASDETAPAEPAAFVPVHGKQQNGATGGETAREGSAEGSRHEAPAAQSAPTTQNVAAATAARAAEAVQTTAQPVPPVRAKAQLHELAEVARTTIRTATRSGRTEARIDLEPAELGAVQIRLRYFAGGVSAQLTAESSQAAAALAETATDLRRALESQGLVVRSLDVLTGSQHQRSERDPQSGEGKGDGTGSTPGVAAEDEEVVVETTRVPLAGSSVDVLA